MRKDWEEIEFGDLCKFSQGVQVPKGKQYSENNADRVRFLRIVDFTQGNEEPRYIEKPDDSNIVTKEDISMVRYGTVGFVCTGKEGAIANNLFRVIPKIDIENSYLINYLQSSLFKRHLNSKGATMQALSFGLIKPIKIPLPSIEEQRAIVAKIEELFSDLDKGVADLNKAQDQLKVYRQAVLKKAFEGELTKEWREQQTKNEKWESLTFNDVLEIVSGKNQKHVEDPNGKYPIYGSGGIFGKSNQYLCEGGTTIIGRKGTINSPIYVNERFWNVDTAFGLSPSGKISSLFLFYFCLGFNFKSLDKSTTIPSLAKRDLLKIHINIPPQEEQHQIVQEIESRLSVCDKVEENITESLKKAEALRQSILKKAFEGNLLSTQEIEKFKTAPDYEPAAVLLEKIKMKQ